MVLPILIGGAPPLAGGVLGVQACGTVTAAADSPLVPIPPPLLRTPRRATHLGSLRLLVDAVVARADSSHVESHGADPRSTPMPLLHSNRVLTYSSGDTCFHWEQ